MVNVFATGEVEHGLDSIFPVVSNLHVGLKNMIFISSIARVVSGSQGRIQDFKLGGALRKTAPSGGRPEQFWGISCEKGRFYAKKSFFFSNFRGGGAHGSAPGSCYGVMIAYVK